MKDSWVAIFALGNVAVLQGRFAEAGRHLEAAQPLLDESGDQGWTSPMLKNFAQVAMLNNWGLVISSGAAAGSADVSATQADAWRYFSFDAIAQNPVVP